MQAHADLCKFASFSRSLTPLLAIAVLDASGLVFADNTTPTTPEEVKSPGNYQIKASALYGWTLRLSPT